MEALMVFYPFNKRAIILGNRRYLVVFSKKTTENNLMRKSRELKKKNPLKLNLFVGFLRDSTD
jgi:hypothetical protein